ncbi:MAG: Uma2 family endonuclease [Armatimonadota bacterium]|nr:Uma2 family endonuclease [Armatimonadota bacterium]
MMAGEDDSGRRRWTRDEYYRMGDMGAFDDVRVELLAGIIWEVPPPTPPRATVICMAAASLKAVVGDAFSLRQRGPLVLTDDSEPEPDLLVVPGSWRDYTEHHPTAADACLVIEVSDMNLAKNRGIKTSLYARANIAEYWIVNLLDRQLEVYRDPGPLPEGPGYKFRQVLFDGDTVTPLFAPESTLSVADLFPPLAAQ